MGGAAGSIKGRETLQRNLDKSEGWAITNHMKFNKCQIVHLGRGNPGYPYRLGDKRLESSPTERDLGVLANSKLNTSQQCVLAAKNTNWVLGCTKHGVTCQSKEMTVLLCSALHWCGLPASTVCSFGCHNMEMTLSY